LFLDNGLIFQLSPLIFTEYLNFNPLFVFHIDIGRPPTEQLARQHNILILYGIMITMLTIL